MAVGGARPGAGRPKGARSKSTIKREIIEKAAMERQIAKRAAAPIQGKLTLERLLNLALEQLDLAIAGGKNKEFWACWERTLVAARELTQYQSPRLKALAVAHTDMRPPMIDLRRLSTKQLDVLAQLVQIAGPSTVAGDGAKVVNGKPSDDAC